MKSAVRLFVFAAVVAACVSVPAQAQVDWGVRAGMYLDETEPFVGAEAIMPISRSWFFNPNVELVLADDEFVTINADVHYDFGSRRDRFTWLGAGLAAIVGDEGDNRGDDDTDFAVNLLGGIGGRWGSTVPYAQVKAILADETEVAIGAGLRF